MLTTRARLKPAFPTHGIFHELYYVPLTYIPSLSACHKFVLLFLFFLWMVEWKCCRVVPATVVFEQRWWHFASTFAGSIANGQCSQRQTSFASEELVFGDGERSLCWYRPRKFTGRMRDGLHWNCSYLPHGVHVLVTHVWRPECVYLPPSDEPWTYPYAVKNTSRVFVREKAVNVRAVL